MTEIIKDLMSTDFGDCKPDHMDKIAQDVLDKILAGQRTNVGDGLPEEGKLVIIQTKRGNIAGAKVVGDRWKTNKFHRHISDVTWWMDIPPHV